MGKRFVHKECHEEGIKQNMLIELLNIWFIQNSPLLTSPYPHALYFLYFQDTHSPFLSLVLNHSSITTVTLLSSNQIELPIIE